MELGSNSGHWLCGHHHSPSQKALPQKIKIAPTYMSIYLGIY